MTTARLTLIALFFSFFGCGDDDGNEAEQRGVGSECVATEDCTEEGQECLTQFSGGYCGIQDCTGDADCPDGSACVTEDEDGTNYCFLVCAEKVDCNRNRSVDNESNCVSSLTFIDDAAGRKVCRPPYGG
jgi:hypothetical protein